MEMRGSRKPEQSDAQGPNPLILAGLCAAILDQIGAYVVTGELGSEFRARIEEAKLKLGPSLEESEASHVAETVRSILAAGSARQRESAQRTAIETQHIVGVLNHALMVLAGGSERSLSRLQRIQSSLQRTSLVRDNDGLRASLADAMKLIREEAAREQEHSERDLADFESQVIRVREQVAANPVRRLPGRAEAAQALVDHIADRPAQESTETTLYVAAFSVDQIRAMVQRYGPDPVEEVFFQVIRERIQPVAGSCLSWRWSAGCIISIFRHSSGISALKQQFASLCRTPVVYRMTLGSRTAVLKVSVSHMVISVADVPDIKPSDYVRSLMSQLDKFAGAEDCHAV